MTRMPYYHLVLVLFVLVLAACGDKPRVQPAGVPVDERSDAETIIRDEPESNVAIRPVPAPSDVRILVSENFERLSLSGSQHAEHLVVEASAGRIRLFEKQGKTLRLLDEGSGFRFLPAAGPLELQGTPYRGLLDVFINPVGHPVAVNQVDLESYLCGVVPNELGPAIFPYPEALKAQAVAARTFAIAGLGTFASRGFDLYADSRSQVYSGVRSEHPLSNLAIEQTRGLVLSFQGEPIAAFYSSTCGGMTEDYSRVFFGEPIPYLRGGIECTDQSSPYHSWSTRVSIERGTSLKERLAIQCLTGLKLLQQNEAGRVEAIRFEGRDRERILRANDFRAVLGLRSNYILQLDTQFDSSGCIRELSIDGKGWGHGVGLCQMGAVTMAQSGVKFADILGHYYPGTRLTNWYE